jgi:branched-chain amino acid aminotransferase
LEKEVESMGEQLIYLNGEFVRKEDAKVSVYDHGFLYGDGVFEGIRSYNGNVFRLEEHLERLYDSAKSVMLEIPHTFEEMTKLVVETLRRNELKDAYIRLIVSRGVGNLGIDPLTCSRPSVMSLQKLYPYFPSRFTTMALKLFQWQPGETVRMC